MGEKFAANPVTGSGSMSVPIATSPGRSGFGPQLGLSYDSGAGNGPFGFGWSLSLPSITRKTDKGLARYRDWSTDPLEADVFVLSGAEDLVPVFRKDENGSWLASQPAGHGLHRDPLDHWILDRNNQFVIHEDLIDGYRVRRYRPRIEGLFARIERWQWIPSAADPRPEALQRADGHWRSISKDNILTIYGADASSRIADPEDPERIFSWLICESRDDKGHGIRYLYKAEDGSFRNDQQDPFLAAHQRNRFKGAPGARTYACTAQRYLKRILYGNLPPLLNPQCQRPRNLADLPNPPSDEAKHWLFEVRFDYGELDENNPTTVAEKAWFYRPDAFSSYRSGFEVRTCRRCERVLMLHHIPDQAATADRPFQKGYEGVVRSTEFSYDDELNPTIASKPIYSFLSQVEQRGWNQANGTTTTKSLPPLEFRYSQPVLGEEVAVVDPASLENLPMGLDGSSYRWVDLHGEGLPGILTEQAGSWFYKRNLSPISQRLQGAMQADVATFAPLEMVASRPNVSLAAGAQILDLAGDGLPDVVSFSGPAPGLYEHDEAEGWQPWRPFRQLPNVNFNDPNLRFIDLDGDGHADLLISEGDVFVWHRSLEEQGFEGAQRVPLPWDEEKGPRVVFADGTESIHLADMSGDGLSDVVRIRAGVHGREICYWPNLGYGRFGAKVSMDNPPLFDHPELFDPKRLLLADIDGSGTTDLIYLHQEGVRLYFNQAGNGWSEAVPLKVFPPIHSAAQVTTVDLLGNGTACLVWSSPLAGDSGRQMRYVPLMAEGKPHLLNTSINNLGAETRVQYCSSLRFYLEDKLNGKPWITRLPFPVHVVERVETIDHISRNRFVSRHAYHHGFFDGEEREFRGFGMVEQWDTERLDAVAGQTNAALGFLNEEAAHTQPPVHTKTWFHTGVWLGQERVSRQYASEYYREPGLTPEQIADQLLPDTLLPEGLSVVEEREACRAFKGMMLRQEVYADDADHPGATAAEIERARTPYTVSEQSFALKQLQERGSNRHAVFFSHPREALTYHYERNPADPRIQHALTLEVDAYGNVRKQAAVGYGRRSSPLSEDWDQERQTTPLLSYTENGFTNAIDSNDQYRTPLPCEAITYELTEVPATGPAGRYQGEDFIEPDPAVPDQLRHRFDPPEIPYEATASGSRRRRPIEYLRTLYRPNDLGAAAGDANQLLPLGQLESLALPGESYKLAFTPGLLNAMFQRPRAGQPAEELLLNADRAQVLGGQGADQGGYVDLDGNGHWWLPSGRSFFSPDPGDDPATELAEARAHFFLPRRIRDPFGKSALVDHDALDLLMAETRDPLNNRITVEANDYRVLQPRLVSDPNRNRSEVAFDVLGMVVGTAVMGKAAPAPVEGDSLAGFDPDPGQNDLDAFFSDPVEANPSDPKRSRATTATRDLLAGATTRIVYDLDRFVRTRQAHPNDPTQWQPAVAATIARETHVSDLAAAQESRLQVSFSYSDGFGREIQKKIQAEPGPLDPQDNSSAQLNPRWVGSSWTVFNNKGKPVRQYEPFFSATHDFEFGVIRGVSPVLFYDPADRVVATLHPNHTWEKVVFDPWQQTSWDVNDTCAAKNAQTGDPRTDSDIGGYVAEYFKTLPATWKTWQAQRISGALGQDERNVALRTEAHADTPTIAHFDTLGRTFLTIADNGKDGSGNHQKYSTRVELDIEGNQRLFRDAKDRIVMRYYYDLLGHRLCQISMEAGDRWMLNNVAGKPIRMWNSRNHVLRTTYDPLQRPTQLFVKTGSDPEILTEKTIYGEGQGDATNHRTRIYQHFDSAGVASNEAFDFKGNLLNSTRQLVQDYKTIPDWAGNPVLETEVFSSSSRYDALNRPIQLVAPYSNQPQTKLNVIHPGYNEANLLERMDVWLGEATEPTALLDPPSANFHAVTNIDHDAKGQRTLIEYGNGAKTAYIYDEKTFRLAHLKTTRGGAVLQDLFYTYDPVGNITRIRDDAQQTTFFNNQVVLPHCDYTYDPIYRLITAAGREHIGQAGQPQATKWDDEFRVNLPHPSEGQAMRNYTEQYVYDAVGNFERLIHQAANGNWTRAYAYNEASLIESGKQSNRLSSTTVGARTEPYTYDAHGNMTSMPHLTLMQWNYKDELRATARQAVNATPPPNTVPEKTFYVYEASGERVRKVTERQNGTRKQERIYLGGFELYREFKSNGTDIKLERETLHGMDDKQRIALVETKTITNPGDESPAQLIRFQFGNHLGSACLELDDKANVISHEEYTPYGSTSYQAVDNSVKAAAKRYRYTGKERDEETGLSYHVARYYVPWLGRWVSCDPIGIKDGNNLYCYVANNPIVRVDADGQQSQKVVGRIDDVEAPTLGLEITASPPHEAKLDATHGQNPAAAADIPKSERLDDINVPTVSNAQAQGNNNTDDLPWKGFTKPEADKSEYFTPDEAIFNAIWRYQYQTNRTGIETGGQIYTISDRNPADIADDLKHGRQIKERFYFSRAVTGGVHDTGKALFVNPFDSPLPTLPKDDNRKVIMWGAYHNHPGYPIKDALKYGHWNMDSDSKTPVLNGWSFNEATPKGDIQGFLDIANRRSFWVEGVGTGHGYIGFLHLRDGKRNQIRQNYFYVKNLLPSSQRQLLQHQPKTPPLIRPNNTFVPSS